MEILITILILTVLLLAFFVYKFYKYRKAKSLFEKIKWCVSYDPHSSFNNVRPELKLRGYIIHLQTENSIDDKYRIIESDFDTVNEILKSYQQDLIQKHFRGYAPAHEKLSDEEYFIVTFWDFLQRHKSENSFNGQEENGSTYHKLSYILQLSSQNIYNLKKRRRRYIVQLH